MVEEIGQYRSAVTDALGRVIPDEGDLRVWLDDELEDRKAPEGWVHLVTAREVCFLLLTGRVVQLSLDHDLSDDIRYGRVDQVIDFLDDQQGQFGSSLWPRDGISLHTANSKGRDKMELAIKTSAGKHLLVTETRPGGQPFFEFV